MDFNLISKYIKIKKKRFKFRVTVARSVVINKHELCAQLLPAVSLTRSPQSVRILVRGGRAALKRATSWSWRQRWDFWATVTSKLLWHSKSLFTLIVYMRIKPKKGSISIYIYICTICIYIYICHQCSSYYIIFHGMRYASQFFFLWEPSDQPGSAASRCSFGELPFLAPVTKGFYGTPVTKYRHEWCSEVRFFEVQYFSS